MAPSPDSVELEPERILRGPSAYSRPMRSNSSTSNVISATSVSLETGDAPGRTRVGRAADSATLAPSWAEGAGVSSIFDTGLRLRGVIPAGCGLASSLISITALPISIRSPILRLAYSTCSPLRIVPLEDRLSTSRRIPPSSRISAWSRLTLGISRKTSHSSDLPIVITERSSKEISCSDPSRIRMRTVF